MQKKIQAVLLSEGHSSRFWPFNNDHKSTYEIAGSPIIIHTIRALEKTNLVKDVFVVHKPSSNISFILPKKMGDMNIVCVEGEENPLGTGASLYKTKDLVDEDFALIWPDMVNSDILIKSLISISSNNGVDSAMIGAETNTPWNFGMLKIEDNIVKEVIEKPKNWDNEKSIKRVGVELFKKDIFDVYSSLKKKHETDLIDAINIYITKHKMALVKQEHFVPVLKYPWDLLTTMSILIHYFNLDKNSKKSNNYKNSTIKENVKMGENFLCKGSIYIGENTTIGSNVKFFGPVIIEENVVIGDDCSVTNSIIGENSHISDGTLIEDSVIAKDNKIGKGCSIKGKMGDKSAVKVVNENKQTISTGRINLGLIMGSNSVIGNNCNINPGSLFVSGTKIKDNSNINFDSFIQ